MSATLAAHSPAEIQVARERRRDARSRLLATCPGGMTKGATLAPAGGTSPTVDVAGTGSGAEGAVGGNVDAWEAKGPCATGANGGGPAGV